MVSVNHFLGLDKDPAYGKGEVRFGASINIGIGQCQKCTLVFALGAMPLFYILAFEVPYML